VRTPHLSLLNFGKPMNPRILSAAVKLALSLILGCSSPQVNRPPNVDALALGVEAAAIREKLPDAFTQLLEASQPPVASPQAGESSRNILVLSAGARDGAYSAGVLAGWSAAGTRPTFDVVTGISTGALIAPFAFLGKNYDHLLLENFTTVHTRDIYRCRPLLAVLWSDSLADSGPLRRRIEEQVTDEFLEEIAQAHRDGRRLYIGTTNLSTGRLTVWDMGAIAAGPSPDRRDLFRKVILASCSIPGMFPPVPIEIELDGQRYTELHSDGGISASMFLHPLMMIDHRRGCPANVYAIVAGKLSPESRDIRRRFDSVFGASVQEMLESRTRGDLIRVFLLSRLAGSRFAVTAVPQDLSVNPDVTRFEPEDMMLLFRAGYARAVTGWSPTPPGVNPEEWLRPRTGTQFSTDGGQVR
jgi:predicted acylesterase/phospholipase RssA